MSRSSGTNVKRLVLRCMPLTEKGVGSAWGLPVIASGKERLSARSLSEKLQPPFAVSFGADPFREEKLRELEMLGIGALGRYLGGEPVKPVPLSAESFFTQNGGRKKENRRGISAAGLFCTALEFEESYWAAEGSAAELFHNHLEFLRVWGFSGGVHVDESLLAPVLADYVRFLHKETVRDSAKIIVIVPKQFFEARLGAELPNAQLSADTSAGAIPVTLAAGGIPVLSSESAGLGIVLREDAAPALRVQKIRCDILITINTEAPELPARLVLAVSTERPAHKKSAAGNGAKTTPPPKHYLYRNLFPAKPGGNPVPLPFPALRKTEAGSSMDWGAGPVPEHSSAGTDYGVYTEKAAGREKAGALGILPQWEAGRTAFAYGAVFTVNAKFSGIRAADFKDEQAMFYAEGKTRTKQVWEAPPVWPDISFSALNEIQRAFYLRWRSECRRGSIRLPPGSPYIEQYVRLYAGELSLCMGKESPLQHFTALAHLFHACGEHYPETADALCQYCVDFIVVYGLEQEAFPVFLNELLNNNWFAFGRTETAETESLLIDLAISFFFIESSGYFEKDGSWPLLKKLIPQKILARKEHDERVPVQFRRTLALLDARLREDWHKSFFTLFFPPVLRKTDFTAFKKNRFAGSSSYTLHSPGFASHKPLLDILSALVLEPGVNPLPEAKIRLHSVSLENELLETLRKESDAVRDMLKTDERTEQAEEHKRQKAIGPGTTPPSHPLYAAPGKTALVEFIASLTKTEQQTIQTIARGTAADLSHQLNSTLNGDIDSINTAFYGLFGDLLIESDGGGYSISAEYAAILGKWE